MDFLDYQDLAMRTAAQHHVDVQKVIASLGLTGEAGEVADHIKKWIAQGHPLDIQHIEKELGDILWYVALMCEAIGTDMQMIAIKNIDKLRKRYPQGFSSDASLHREEAA
jgi:NTP pyrophosphatase (non-canonical NTP hydrolase)